MRIDALGLALGDEPRGEQDDRDSDRDVHEEDPLPAEVLGQDPAEQHAGSGARFATAPQIPNALLRSAPPWLNDALMIASVAGEMIAPPNPWSARNTISHAPSARSRT